MSRGEGKEIKAVSGGRGETGCWWRERRKQDVSREGGANRMLV